MQNRNMVFVDASLPIIERLARKWFPPGIKNEEDIYFGCGFCDMKCSHEEHDDDCIVELAYRCLQEIETIQKDSRYLKDHQGNPRPEQEVKEMRYYWIFKALMGQFYNKMLNELIPLDYQDPHNKSIVCLCYRTGYGGRIKNAHYNQCLYQQLAKNLSELYRV